MLGQPVGQRAGPRVVARRRGRPAPRSRCSRSTAAGPCRAKSPDASAACVQHAVATTLVAGRPRRRAEREQQRRRVGQRVPGLAEVLRRVQGRLGVLERTDRVAPSRHAADRASRVRSQARSTSPSPPSQGWKRRLSSSSSASSGRPAVDQQVGELDAQVVALGDAACAPARAARAAAATGVAGPLEQLVALVPELRVGRARGRAPGRTPRRAASASPRRLTRRDGQVPPDDGVARVDGQRAAPVLDRLVGPVVRVEPVTEQRGRGRVLRVGGRAWPRAPRRRRAGRGSSRCGRRDGRAPGRRRPPAASPSRSSARARRGSRRAGRRRSARGVASASRGPSEVEERDPGRGARRRGRSRGPRRAGSGRSSRPRRPSRFPGQLQGPDVERVEGEGRRRASPRPPRSARADGAAPTSRLRAWSWSGSARRASVTRRSAAWSRPCPGVDDRQLVARRRVPGAQPGGLGERRVRLVVTPRPGQGQAEQVVRLAVDGVGVQAGEPRDGRPQMGLRGGEPAVRVTTGAQRGVRGGVTGVAPQGLGPVGLGRPGGVPVLQQVLAGEVELLHGAETGGFRGLRRRPAGGGGGGSVRGGPGQEQAVALPDLDAGDRRRLERTPRSGPREPGRAPPRAARRRRSAPRPAPRESRRVTSR